MLKVTALKSLKIKILLVVAGACAFCAVTAMIVSVHYNNLDFQDSLVDKSRTIHSRILAACKYVAQQGGLEPIIERYSTLYKSADQLTTQDKENILKQVPIYAGMKIGADGAEKENYIFRIFSDQPRNEKNKATSEELTIFEKFKTDEKLQEWVVENEKEVIVYRPVYLKKDQGCLKCHGDPEASPWHDGKDILGYKMENWTDGKLHGVFAIKNDVQIAKKADVDSGGTSSTGPLVTFICLAAIIAVLLGAAVISRPCAEIKAVAEKLATDSSEVGSAVSQIFSIAQDLSQSTTEQAEATQETASAIEEITQTVKKSANDAGLAENETRSSRSTAEKGQKLVSQMVLSMNDINKNNQNVVIAINAGNQKISEIVSIIEEIGNKTKVINEIVFQTKLLSFNASVEAARAGEHGKGFAVVAEEVGNLAAMSGNAAKEITDLLAESISKVQATVTDTKTTIDTLMSSANKSVDQGTVVVKDCEQMLLEIVNSSTSVCERVVEIAGANKEQANGVEEISKAVHQIDHGTKVGADAAQKSITAAEQLGKKVEELREAAGQLRKIIDGRNLVQKFIWGPELNVGVSKMDDEHKVLIEKMNIFASALEGENKRTITDSFTQLADYTKKHFFDEEKYMEKINYRGLHEHKKVHETLLAEVAAVGLQIQNNQINGPAIMKFLNNWLMRHIHRMDKDYGHYSKVEIREASQDNPPGAHQFEDDVA